jgi:hypothetical protein
MMQLIRKKCVAMRPVAYACLVIVGVGISDRLFCDGSFFQSAGAQQAPQTPQGPQGKRQRQSPAARPTASAAATGEAGSPTASCDQEFSRTDLILPGPKGPIKLDSCYRGREHFICSVNAIIAESQKLRADYDRIVQMNYPTFKTLEPVCRLSSDAVSGDLKAVNDFFPRFRAIKSAFDRQANCAVTMGRTFKEINLSTMANGADITKSMMDAIDGDMKNVADERQGSAELSENIESARKSLEAIEKLHAAMCPAPSKGKS